MEARQKLAISTFGAHLWVREEQVAFLQWVWDETKSSFPSVLEEIQGAIDVLPVLEVEKCVLERTIFKRIQVRIK